MLKNDLPAYLDTIAVSQACTVLHRAAQDVLGGVAGQSVTISFEDRQALSPSGQVASAKNLAAELQFEHPTDVQHSLLVLADAGEIAALFGLDRTADAEAMLTADSILRLGDIISSFIDTLVGELIWLRPSPRAWLGNLEPLSDDDAGVMHSELPPGMAAEPALYRLDLRIIGADGSSCSVEIILGEDTERALLVVDQAPAVEQPKSGTPRAHEPAPGARQPQYEMQEARQGPTGARQGPSEVQPAQFQPLGFEQSKGRSNSIDLIRDVPLKISVELGRASLTVREVLALGAGSVVELDRLAGEPVDVLVNDRLIARGEVVIVDESFGIRITDILRDSNLRGAS